MAEIKKQKFVIRFRDGTAIVFRKTIFDAIAYARINDQEHSIGELACITGNLGGQIVDFKKGERGI